MALNEGEVRAQFRLLGDNVKGDVSRIQSSITDQMKQSGRGTPLSKVASDMDKIAASMGRSSERIFGSASAAFRARNPHLFSGSGGGGGGGITNASAAFSGGFGGESKAQKAAFSMQKDRAAFIKDATFAMMPIFNPTSVWGNLFASRQIFSAFSGTKTGIGAMGKIGLSGVGGASIAAGGTVGVLLAVGLAIKALTKTMQGVLKAYQEAPSMYAKALTTGLGIGFVTKRSLLAGIMGVSELDVIKFGAAMKYLNPQIEWASSILAKTNANLTSVGWGFKVLDFNMKAMFATLGNDAAPAIRRLTNALSELVKFTATFHSAITKGLGMALKGGVAGAFSLAFGPVAGSAIMKGLSKFAGNIGADTGSAPPAMSWMKQLPASSWEHMGLVIGGGGNNPARQTAENTKKSAQTLQQIKQAICRPSGMSIFSPAQSYQ